MDYLRRYDRMADKAAAQVIAAYSTSFHAAAGLLAPRMRRDIRNMYAMLRIADEIVDGTAAGARLSRAEVTDTLANYERAVREAPCRRFHTDPVLHAYANTARRCGFADEHVAAFFRSMRADVEPQPHTASSLADYIYGSAEAVGLLCVAVFTAGVAPTPHTRRRLDKGAAALGSAFQKINFLRDAAEDNALLGRFYVHGGLAGDGVETLDGMVKDRIVAEVRAELELARQTIPLLPRGARAGVWAATELYGELTDRVDRVGVDDLLRQRVSVPNGRKAVIIARAALGRC